MVLDIQGTMYGVVFKRSPQGKTIVTKKPDMSGVEWSKAQKNNRKRMRYSNNYAKAAMADPAVRAVYEKRAAKEGRVAYNVALSDYWKGINLLSEPPTLPAQKNEKAGKARLSRPRKGIRKPSKAQQAQWDCIIEAAAYAATALADPELCADYEAEAKKLDMQPRHVAIADYLHRKNLLSK
jgi:hypothetical protein